MQQGNSFKAGGVWKKCKQFVQPARIAWLVVKQRNAWLLPLLQKSCGRRQSLTGEVTTGSVWSTEDICIWGEGLVFRCGSSCGGCVWGEWGECRSVRVQPAASGHVNVLRAKRQIRTKGRGGAWLETAQP